MIVLFLLFVAAVTLTVALTRWLARNLDGRAHFFLGVLSGPAIVMPAMIYIAANEASQEDFDPWAAMYILSGAALALAVILSLIFEYARREEWK